MGYRLLILDSGVGGLSVVAEIRKIIQNADITYVADNGGFPYGNLDDATLIDRITRVIDTLMPLVRPDAIVIACNTASTIALAALRARFDPPIIGVVPAIKPAAALTRTGTIGLLATPATVSRPYLTDLIDRFARDLTVVTVGAQRLAALAEAALRGIPPDPAIIAEEIAPLFAGQSPDVVVLGCTHYPLLRVTLEDAAPAGIRWLDSGAAVARRTAEILATLPPKPGPLASDIAVFTVPCAIPPALAAALGGFGLARTAVIAVRAFSDPVGSENALDLSV